MAHYWEIVRSAGEVVIDYFYGESYIPTSVNSCDTRANRKVMVTLFIEGKDGHTGIVEWRWTSNHRGDAYIDIIDEVLQFCKTNASRIFGEEVFAENISFKEGGRSGRYGYNTQIKAVYKLVF